MVDPLTSSVLLFQGVLAEIIGPGLPCTRTDRRHPTLDWAVLVCEEVERKLEGHRYGHLPIKCALNKTRSWKVEAKIRGV
jgi:hypothetical protein